MSGAPNKDGTDVVTSAPTHVSSPVAPETTARGDLGEGSLVGRYRLTSRLGAGAMGEVWAAIDPQLEREVAIKLVHPKLAANADVSARMVREARAMAKVSHRGVIAIHDAGEADGHLFLAMELVRGRTLGALFRRRTGEDLRDWRRWLAMVIEAGRGLAAAHAAGVLHRDFKPDNVLVDHHDRVCVGDFGLATLGAANERPSRREISGSGAVAEPTLTMTGALLGTPAYMSLEQLRGEPIDARADQFSFCVVAYESVYGARPFAVPSDEQNNLAALVDALEAGAITTPPLGRVPHEVRAILLRGLASRPGDRWPDLDSLLAALDIAIAPAARARRTRLVVAAAATGLVVAAAVIALAHVARSSTAPQATQPTAVAIAPVPLRAAVAVSPNGRIAIATDHIEVRDPNAPDKSWTTNLPPGREWIQELQFIGEDTLRWRTYDAGAITRWDFTVGTQPADEPAPPSGVWLGAMANGDLMRRPGAVGVSVLALATGKETLRAWQLEASSLEVFAISPSGRRFAYISADRFNGHIVVLDTTTGQTWRSAKLRDGTGLAWRGENTLLYGSFSSPKIYEVAFDEHAFGEPRTVYRLDDGFVGRVFVTSAHLLFIAIRPATRVRVIDRDAGSVHDLEPSAAAGELGWTADGEFVTWTRGQRELELRRPDGRVKPLHVQLESEPANATLAGDVVLVALHDAGGRKLVAVSLTGRKTLWQHAVGASFAARCALDLAPPCFVARRTSDPGEQYEVLALDPNTGATSGPALYRGSLEDFAVNADGAELLVADSSSRIHRIDRSGAEVGTISVPLRFVRSVAYTSDGILLGGTGELATYVVGHYDLATGQFSPLTTVGGEILSLVRPSPTSRQILALGRELASQLWQTELPPE